MPSEGPQQKQRHQGGGKGSQGLPPSFPPSLPPCPALPIQTVQHPKNASSPKPSCALPVPTG
jgi:hypothetical protein